MKNGNSNSNIGKYDDVVDSSILITSDNSRTNNSGLDSFSNQRANKENLEQNDCDNDEININIFRFKFKDDFTNWLIEQYPKKFINLNGYEILKSYINFRYGDEIEFDRKDYQFFVSFKREIIVEIKIWLETFQLTFEDYKIYFELFIEDLNLNYKSSFEKILALNNSYL